MIDGRVVLIFFLCMLVAPAMAGNVDFPWCAQQDMFFWNGSSNLTDARVLEHIPELDSQRTLVSPPITASSGEVTLGTWITNAGSPGNLSIAPGLWRFRTYAYTSSASGKTYIKFRLFNQTATGVRTFFFFGNAITDPISSGTTPSEYLTSYARRNITRFFPGDRLGIQVNVSTDSTAARTVTMELAGNTNASMVSGSYFLCSEVCGEETGTSSTSTTDFGADATAAAFGLVGGLITSILVVKQYKNKRGALITQEEEL